MDREAVVRHLVSHYGGRRVMVMVRGVGAVPAWCPPAMSDGELARDLAAEQRARAEAERISDLGVGGAGGP